EIIAITGIPFNQNYVQHGMLNLLYGDSTAVTVDKRESQSSHRVLSTQYSPAMSIPPGIVPTTVSPLFLETRTDGVAPSGLWDKLDRAH
ncbi:MAG: hypothetical protein JWM57_4030, partial [Phycisphaerales bacterium]|nr:hypothetical protein [Phycisphaerales bacterium]